MCDLHPIAPSGALARPRPALAAVAIALCACAAPAQTDDRPVRVEAIAVGGPPSNQWFDFDVPSIDAAGNVVFAHPSGHVSLQSTQLYAWDGSAITMILSNGNPVGGLPGVSHAPGGFYEFAAGAGAVCVYDNIAPYPYFSAISVGPYSDIRALLWDRSNVYLPAPGLPGVSFLYAPRDAAVTSEGQVAFCTSLRGGPTPAYGIWAGSPEDLYPVAVGGQPAPGFEPGVVFSSAYGDTNPFSRPQMSEEGRVAFSAVVSAGYQQPRGVGIWLADPQAPPQLIVATGQAAPSTPPGSVIGSIYGFFPTASGEVIFSALIERDSTPVGAGVFAGTPGSLHAVAVPGDPVALPDGTSAALEGVYTPIEFNSQGWFVAQGRIRKSTATSRPIGGSSSILAVLVGNGSEVRAVAVSGAKAVGAAPGVVYDSIDLYDPLFQPQLGADGRFAVRIQLRFPGYGNQTASAIYACDRRGTFRLVAQEGRPVYTACGLIRTPANVYSAPISLEVPHGAGRRRSMSDDGRLVLYMWFGTYGGVFYADADQVRCEADFDCDGRVSIADVPGFLNAASVGDMRADLNHDGTVDNADFAAFMQAILDGC